MADGDLPRDPSESDAQPGPDGAPENTGAETGSPDVGAGRLIDIKIENELQDSYLTYAMSTIMDRALPDVRDGLKPSQRRILVAMNDLKLRPGKKHLKCAKICGDTSGNYHPHGESVIYPTMVGMAQAWKMRVLLVDPLLHFLRHALQQLLVLGDQLLTHAGEALLDVGLAGLHDGTRRRSLQARALLRIA